MITSNNIHLKKLIITINNINLEKSLTITSNW